MSGRRTVRLKDVALAAVAMLAASRIPGLARDGTHDGEVNQLQSRQVSSLSWLPRGVTESEGNAIVYLYAESCPYCAIDHKKVRAASKYLESRRQVPFIAAHIGAVSLGMGYWKEAELARPEDLVMVAAEQVTSDMGGAVPVVIVIRDGVIRRAWLGLLRWDTDALEDAIRCEFGESLSCLQLGAGDVWRGFSGRVRQLVGRGGRVEAESRSTDIGIAVMDSGGTDPE